MRFYTTQHPFYCGIDLHACSMDVCILNQASEIMLHRNMQASPETFLKAIAPYREERVGAVACLFTWYWLADLCAPAGMPFVLGHALSMKAIQGGKANRDGVAARFPAPAVPKSLAVDLALLGYDEPLHRARALPSVKAAQQHDPNTLYLLQTVPGIGTILRLVLLYASHAIQRFPSVQDCVSSGRLVKCAKASAGKRSGTAGAKSGKASLTGAFSEAAVLLLRDHPAGQKSLTRLEKKYGPGKALTLLAPKLGRAVYDMFKRPKACAVGRQLHWIIGIQSCFQ